MTRDLEAEQAAVDAVDRDEEHRLELLDAARRQEAADAAEREQALRERDEAESVETIEAEWSRAFACHDEPRVFYSDSHQEKFVRG